MQWVDPSGPIEWYYRDPFFDLDAIDMFKCSKCGESLVRFVLAEKTCETCDGQIMTDYVPTVYTARNLLLQTAAGDKVNLDDLDGRQLVFLVARTSGGTAVPPKYFPDAVDLMEVSLKYGLLVLELRQHPLLLCNINSRKAGYCGGPIPGKKSFPGKGEKL